MNVLRTIVVDDEPLALQLLSATLTEQPDVEVVAECRNGREAVEAVLNLSPDLMYLDIRMPGLTGFDVVQKLQPEVMPMVVFCTAYDQYAVDAFEVYAVDYVLKPFDSDRIALSVRRAQDRFNKDQSELEIVASNSVGETVDATPAPVDEELFIRGERHLFCIATQ